MNMFNSVELRKPQRSTFDLSHDKRLSCQMGYLYPILVTECLPSDSFYGGSDILVRMAPMIAPIFEQVQVYIHYFFVPNRLLWTEWEDFITGGQFGPTVEAPLSNYIPPNFGVVSALGEDPTCFAKSKLPDYLGVPILLDLPNAPDPVDWTNCFLDAMPFAAYQKIWFDYYRDRRFVNDNALDIDGVGLPMNSGTVNPVDIFDWIDKFMTLRSRCYRHDYFTSANVEAQLGDNVMIPSTVNYLESSVVREADGTLAAAGGLFAGSTVAGRLGIGSLGDGRVENLDTIGPLVNDFRTAYALQVWLERNAVAGSRYTESLQAHFAVRPQDSRLQRAEYIGGGLVNVKISEVVATAWSQDDTDSFPQGNLAGHGVTFGSNSKFSYFCPEHGFIMGMLSIVNPPSYHQGLPRYFRRGTFLDYPWPTFAKLGEQEVYDFEIYAASVNWNHQNSDGWPVFGYQSRYADWKSKISTNHGDFHDTLLHWSLTNDFGITPVNDQTFTVFNPLIEERIFAVPSGDNFWVYLHNRVTAKRPLPYFGTPNNLGFS